ncbi:hypothetical protein DFJ67_6031 [Asanoa ferruginea]|uniref:Uncharacterized protein n=1 Tax=Asanoa ferruginea TaxID=53367 RepID=A0A3D9ZTP6_9ACTN|nr:hypothetical protein DFJ67_6031 [Asanoa ferruginea]
MKPQYRHFSTLDRPRNAQPRRVCSPDFHPAGPEFHPWVAVLARPDF